jgi:hypothetical protein
MTTTTTATSSPGRKGQKPLPRLQHGDHLTREEFERRWEQEPDLKKAELLGGMVFLGSEYRGRIIDPKIPPLENGDHLGREEFERRWDNMPDLKKAELLNGMVFMPPPVSAESHGAPHTRLIFWLASFWSATPEMMVVDNSTLRFPEDDEAQPDAMLFVLPEHGGRARLDAKGYVHGSPELIAEVAASSANYDLNVKRDIYRRNGIAEYVVWSVYEETITWLVLGEDGDYRLESPDGDGIYRSRQFAGLWLDPKALLAGDLAAVLRVTQQGTSTSEHTEFRAQLNRNRS